MSDKTWKQTERSIAKRLGGVRVGNRGQATPDVISDWLAVEVKTRRSLPKWLKDALAQACAGADASQLPVAILHEAGRRHDDDLVVLSLKGFEQWFGWCDIGGE